jgi:hypothetical protein
MVPTAGLEPAQVAPLAPQTSASTNFATSAFHGPSPKLSTGFAARTPTNRRRFAPLRNSSLHAPNYFGGSLGAGAGVVAGAGAAGAGATGVGATAGAAVPGAGAGAGALVNDRSNTLLGSPGARVPMYASDKLVTKNSAANTAVNLENRVLVPRAPKTVPDAPEPKPAPASAPLPRCSRTRPIIISASSTCTAKMKPRNIEISQ